MHKFLIIFALFSLTSADWTFPHFIDQHEEIVNITYLAVDYVKIEMNEEVPAPFTLAVLNEYDDDESPSVSSQFSEGNATDLGLRFVKNDTKWSIIITRTQDYENIANRRYIFDLKAKNVEITVEIIILNIFDNEPSVEFVNPCRVEELTDPDYVTSCSYNVYDADGMANNLIRFEIQGTNNEDELFGFEKIDESDYDSIYNLTIKTPLDYVQRFYYSFRVTVYDAGNKTFQFSIIIEVINIPHRPPMFTKVFASAQFDEKEEKNFETEAIDGDTGIMAPICYKLDFEPNGNYSELISINEENGKIHVKEIDRDELKIDFFPFIITAFKCNNEESNVSNSAVLIVNDKNDNIPLIYFSEEKNVIEFYEETFFTLFNQSELRVEDIDLGTHAMYTVKLSPDEFASAFNIVPETGYQEQYFTISVANTSMLDYEDPNFQVFNIYITATEIDEESHFNEKMFEVRLINWNDELPYFFEEEYVFDVNETELANFQIGFVEADDRDINDTIEYYLVGRIGEKISVDKSSGLLMTIVDDAFDYEQQTEISFQVFATDTLITSKNEATHKTSTQVTINVLDINDAPPSINLPRSAISVTENDTDAIIAEEIEVFDPDTTAKLSLFIDWEKSTASGVNVKREDYEGCLEIETEEVSNNKLIGTLKINSSHLIDYEKFQLLFLTITALDSNTIVNDNQTSAVLTVRIIDINDNAPEFVGNTLSVRRSVVEESESGIFIGFINAVDIDGPGNNIITYSLIPIDEETDGWITIDSSTGEISVEWDKGIDCDIPLRETLDCTIHLNDGVWDTYGNISIRIIDTNNKVPYLGNFDAVVRIYENATDVNLTTIIASDDDRDEPHNIAQYSINFASNSELQRYFKIDENTGELRVKELDEYNKLDRDNEPSEYYITITIEDNRGIGTRNSINTSVHVILLDCNDNAPNMPSSLNFVSTQILENVNKSTIIIEQFYAPDIDEGLNAEVLYEIKSIEPIEVDNENLSDYENLFILENYKNLENEYKYARISTGIDLRGFSGTWSMTIIATDRGSEGDSGISQSSFETYEIKIEPFNYRQPIIVFPERDSVIRIDLDSAVIGRTLTLLTTSDTVKLNPFEGVDDDAGIYGDITFIIDSDNGDHNHFEIVKLNKKQSELYITSDVEEKTYLINIMAYDGGNLRTDKIYFSIAFIDRTSQPYFTNNNWTARFTENTTGLDETVVIDRIAIDRKNIGVVNEDEMFKIYYFLDDTYDDANLFTLNKSTRELKLTQMLDREEIDHHSIRIFATNQDTMPSIRQVSDDSFLYIHINVDDVNDNPPTFVSKRYSASITPLYNIGKNLLTLNATDPDLDDVITFYLLRDTITVSDDSLANVRNSAFLVNQNTGELTLNFEISSTMKGYFEFQVQANDLVNHTDTADVKIFIVGNANQIDYTFLNTVEEVELVDKSELSDFFVEMYEIDQFDIGGISEYQTDSGVESDKTILRCYMILNDEALDANAVYEKTYDIQFATSLAYGLRTKFGLIFQGVETEKTNPDEESNNLLELILAILCGVFFIALIAVVILYVIQSRRYNRQLRAMSEKKFEPESDTKNIFNIKALPNTNKFSEGKQINPVMIMNSNNGKLDNFDVDTKSIISTDSDDFANLHDNPIFNISAGIGDYNHSMDDRKNISKNQSTFA